MSNIVDNPKKHGGGPKTPEGKRRSSLNATRHGLLSRSVVLPNEDPDAFQELVDDYMRDFAPQTRFEVDLVQELAATRWRLQRIWSMESTIMQIGMKRTEQAVKAEFGPEPGDNVVSALAFIEMSAKSRELQLLSRYEARLSKRFHQIQQELKAIAATRKPAPQPKKAEVRNELPPHAPMRLQITPTAPNPSKIPPPGEDAA